MPDALGLAGTTAAPIAPLDPAILAAQPHEMDDGGVELHLDGDNDNEIDPRDAPHDANLADLLDQSDLATIASDLIEGIEADVDSNAEYFAILSAGYKLLGLKPGERSDMPFRGSSAAIHPLLKESVTRFGANASGELLPPDGPVKIKIIGDGGPDKERQAQRKQDYMNFYLTEEDEEYCDDFDQMCMLVGLNGSMFRKVWRDPLRGGAPTSRHFSPYDVVVSHHATTMHGPYRVTHIEPMAASDVKRLQLQSWFSDIDLSQPSDDTTPARTAREAVDYRRPTDLPDDVDHVIYHCHCLRDVPRLEHKDKDGEPTGLPLPYVVSIDAESGKIVRLARNYAKDDPNFRPREYFAHYKYMPGLGFFGWGFIHLVGGDTDTLSVLRRQAINSFTLNSFPGGLKTKGVTADNTDLVVGPGQFKDVETGGLPIQQAVMPMPYRDVPPSYGPLVEEVLSGGQRMGSVADAAVGDGRADALPGTVLALITQATKVESAVIKRMHRAQRKELRLIADLFGAMDQATYPYAINGQQGMALKADFGTNTDVCPVSDPNLPTQTQRLSQAQATLTIAEQSNGLVSVKAATEDMFRIMGKSDQDIAHLMPPPNAGVPADPVTEFATAMQGGPLKAGPAQDHAAHVQAHMAQLTAPGLDKAPPGHALMAHIADHTALFYLAQAQRTTGLPMPPPPGAGPPAPPMPPAQENQIAAAVAASSDALRQALTQLAPPTPGATDPAQAQKNELEKLKIVTQQHDQDRKAEETARQDEIEVRRTVMTMDDNKAQRDSAERIAAITAQGEHDSRTSAERVAAIQLEIARIKTGGEVAGAVVDHHTEAASGDAAVTVAQEKTKQAEHAATARTETKDATP